MRLLPKPRRRPKRNFQIGVLPDIKRFNGYSYVKHHTTYSSKVEANHKVEELKKQGRYARKVRGSDGMWAIYSRDKNV